MAKQKTFKNPGSQVDVKVNGYAVLSVGPGQTYSTADPEVQTALRKSGFVEVSVVKPQVKTPVYSRQED